MLLSHTTTYLVAEGMTVVVLVDKAIVLSIVVLDLRSARGVVGVADETGEVGEEQGPHPRWQRPVLLVVHVQHEHGQHRRRRYQ